MAFGYNPYSYTTTQQYNPYAQYMPQIAQVPQAPQAQPQQGVVWVQGEEGAKSAIVPAGQSAVLMDSERDVFYLKAVDASGMPYPLRIFDYKERGATEVPSATAPICSEQEEYITRSEFEKAIAELKEDKKEPKKVTKKGEE